MGFGLGAQRCCGPIEENLGATLRGLRVARSWHESQGYTEEPKAHTLPLRVGSRDKEMALEKREPLEAPARRLGDARV